MKGDEITMSVKISDAELVVMRILWRENRPLSFAEIRKELSATTTWNKSTMQTLIVRLREKGFINTQQHYVTLYTSNITEETYVQSEGKNFIDKLFNGNAKNLVASLCKSGQLDEADIDELKNYFGAGGKKN